MLKEEKLKGEGYRRTISMMEDEISELKTTSKNHAEKTTHYEEQLLLLDKEIQSFYGKKLTFWERIRGKTKIKP
jgi:DNA repair exonuclease SbcCD ATPase subunit